MAGSPDLAVELLADHPELIAQLGRMYWQEWGYGAVSPDGWIEVAGRSARHEGMPITIVAVDSAGDLVGAVGLEEADDELNETERGAGRPGSSARSFASMTAVGRSVADS